jgi:hypothetical protein
MRKLGVWAAVFAVAGVLAGCSNSPNSNTKATTTTTSATTTTTTTTGPSAAFTAAKAQWNQGSCAASAVQGQYWQTAATDLQTSESQPATATAIADLKQLITLPDMGLTSTQSNEFQSDVQYLDGFFDTPGLYSTATGNCSTG